MNIGKLKRSTQIAIMTGAGSGAVEKTASGTSPLTLSDSVAGNIHSITVKGHSEVVDGDIKSVGDAGWGVVDLGTLMWVRSTSYTNAFFYASVPGLKGNGNGIAARFTKIANTWASNFGEIANDNEYCFNTFPTSEQIYIRCDAYTDFTDFKSAMSGVLLYYPLADTTGATPIFGITSKDGAGQGTAATITTGLPLRSTLDGTVYDELTNDKVITRCEVVDNEVVPLTTPTETPLTSAEIVALAALKTYDPTTVISVTDNPSITVKYMGKNITRTAPKKRTSRKKKA